MTYEPIGSSPPQDIEHWNLGTDHSHIQFTSLQWVPSCESRRLRCCCMANSRIESCCHRCMTLDAEAFREGCVCWPGASWVIRIPERTLSALTHPRCTSHVNRVEKLEPWSDWAIWAPLCYNSVKIPGVAVDRGREPKHHGSPLGCSL